MELGLYEIKVSGIEAAKVGASVFAGAALAKVGSTYIPDIPGLSAETMEWVKPLVPIAAGIAVHHFGKYKYPSAAPGVAAGMVAFGVSALVKKAVEATVTDVATKESVKGYLPFAGIDGYELPYTPRYISAAPVQVQQMNGAPVQVQALSGLGRAPLSATLM